MPAAVAQVDPLLIAASAVAPPEVVAAGSHRVWCDGPEGGGPLGHPRVYLEIGAAGFVECGYCGRRFVLAEGAHAPDESERLDPGDDEGAGGR